MNAELKRPWPLRTVTLKVLDLDAQAAFYRGFGLAELERTPSQALLGAGQRPLLRLRLLEGGRPRAQGTAGLYHFALLVPSEPDLGSFLLHASSASLPFVGAGDHLVSQALYFEDPEGNGIEVYADRPRSTWTYDGDQVRMATLPVDTRALAAQGDPHWRGLAAGTLLGHMHLSVADLDRSAAHYQGLGMRVIASLGDHFRFLSWDGYHHHLGLNLLQGRGAAAVPPGQSGLESFAVDRAGEVDLTAPDPDGVVVTAAAAQP